MSSDINSSGNTVSASGKHSAKDNVAADGKISDSGKHSEQENMSANGNVSGHGKRSEPDHVLVKIPMDVRWRDMDAFGHVNNAMYLSYLEEARIRWMANIPGVSMRDSVLPVVVGAQVNYRLPITWPNNVVVELFVEKLGNSSITIGHRIVSEKNSALLHSDGNVTLVWMDVKTGKSVSLPETVRNAVSL